MLTMQAVNEEVNDAAWCPACSTVLASATAGGRLELWDLAQSIVKPAALHLAPQVSVLWSFWSYNVGLVLHMACSCTTFCNQAASIV